MVNKDLKDLSSGAKSKPRATPKRKRASRSKKKPTPGWVWMLGGLSMGLVVAVFVYLGGDSQPEMEQKAEVKTDPKPEPKVAKVIEKTPEQDEEEPQEERFEFYHLLSKLEVIIPDSEIKKMQESIAPKEDVTYIIQAGSFRNYDDADSVKAQLAFLGIEADVQQVESKGVDWYRVRVGPFESTRELNKVRNRIHSADINTMVIKVKKDS